MKTGMYFIALLLVFSGCAAPSNKRASLGSCYDEIKSSKKIPNISETGLKPVEVGLFLCDLKEAVATDNRKKLAKMIGYPVEVAIGNKFKTLKSKEEFLGYYDEIINEKVKGAISAQEYSGLRGNWQGVEIGAGVVWITQNVGEPMLIMAIHNGNLHHYYDPNHPRPDIQETK